MKKLITTLLLVLALVGYVGLPSTQAAKMAVVNINSDEDTLGATFGVNEAHNGIQAQRDRDTDRNFHFGAGERWSQYPPYYRSEQ